MNREISRHRENPENRESPKLMKGQKKDTSGWTSPNRETPPIETLPFVNIAFDKAHESFAHKTLSGTPVTNLSAWVPGQKDLCSIHGFLDQVLYISL